MQTEQVDTENYYVDDGSIPVDYQNQQTSQTQQNQEMLVRSASISFADQPKTPESSEQKENTSTAENKAKDLVSLGLAGLPSLFRRKSTFKDETAMNMKIISAFRSLEDIFCLPVGYYGDLGTIKTVYSSIKRRKVILKIQETPEHIIDDPYNDILFFDTDKPRIMLDKLALIYDLLYLELDGDFEDLAENSSYDFSVFKKSPLRHLIIKNNNTITTMDGIQHIPNLQYIELLNCPNLVHVYKFINSNIICRVNNCNNVVDDKENVRTEDKLIIYS